MPKFSVVHQVDSNRRPSTIYDGDGVSRPAASLDTAADQPARPGIPPSAVGVAFRAGSGRKARDGPYKLFNCYVDRAGVPTAQFESRRVLLRLTSSTIEYMRLSDRVPMYRTVTSGPERT